MPVRFRCVDCRSKLSIATRKIGTTVECPKCRRTVLVPATSEAGERQPELELVGAASGAARSNGSPAPPPFPTPADLEDRPLFERDDFEEMFDPAVKAAKGDDEPLPLPSEPTTKPGEPKRVAEEGILILRSTATILVAAVVVLMAVAFAAGVLVGSR